MASALLRRLLRRRPLIATLLPNLHLANHHQFQTLAASSPLLPSRSIDSRLASLLSPSKGAMEGEGEEVGDGAKYEYVYPSFSYGMVLSPIFEVEVEEGEGMWADSTKKKRKKKMNKHKYRKMRRKLRHRG